MSNTLLCAWKGHGFTRTSRGMAGCGKAGRPRMRVEVRAAASDALSSPKETIAVRQSEPSCNSWDSWVDISQNRRYTSTTQWQSLLGVPSARTDSGTLPDTTGTLQIIGFSYDLESSRLRRSQPLRRVHIIHALRIISFFKRSMHSNVTDNCRI